MTTKEWILTGALSAVVVVLGVFVGISGYLAQHIISSTDSSITDLTGKFDALTKELGADKAVVASLNTAGQSLRDDISHTRTTVDDNGRKLDGLIKSVAYMEGRLKLTPPPE